MKKSISLFLCIAIVFSLLGESVFAEIDASLGTEVVAGAAAAESFYESSVLYRMAERGAALNPNSKGIAFEIMASDTKNLMSPGTKTVLSTSMTDPVADLVTTNCSGETVQLIQCKTGSSAAQINKTLDQVAGGKYSEAELLTTTEFGQKFNEGAEKRGIEQKAVDSHIKESTVEKICSEYLNQFGTQAEIFNTAIEYSGYSAIITAAFVTAESIYKGYSLEEAAAHVTTESAISAVSVGFGTMAAGEMAVLMSSLGASAVAATAASGTIILLVPMVTGYALHVIAEKTGFEDKLKNVAEYLSQQVKDFGESYVEAFGTFCTNCGADLDDQEGYDPTLDIWACTECGMLMTSWSVYSGELYPDIIWFCDECNACLSKQKGFRDIYDSWTCTECGHVNPIGEEAIEDDSYQFDNSLINEAASIGSKVGNAVGGAVNDVYEFFGGLFG